MYLIMPKMHHEHHHHNSMHHEHHHHNLMHTEDESSSRQFFPFLDHLDCLVSHSLELEDLDRFSRFLFKFNRKDLHFFASLFY